MDQQAKREVIRRRVPQVEYALDYAVRGWRVFPVHSVKGGKCTCGKANCGNVGKHPQWHKEDLAHGLTEATADKAQIKRWWARWPDANIGIATGPESGLLILDVDKGTGGGESLERLENEHGDLPPTIVAETGGGGLHFFFKHPGHKVKSRAGKFAPGLDVKADGGYVVAAPSMHASGQQYRWEKGNSPFTRDLARCPGWLLKLMMEGGDKVAGTKALNHPDDPIPHGRRNEYLTGVAGTMQRCGMTQPAIVAALKAEYENKCEHEPPLSDDEIEGIAKGIGRYPAGFAEATERPLAICRCAADIESRPVSWLWRGRIPCGKLTLLIGHPGKGKSLVTLDMAARISNGTDWPDARPCKRGHVIILSGEDEAEDTLVPRLTAAGADLRQITILEGVQYRDQKTKELRIGLPELDKHMPAICDIVEQKQARLLVIDPVSSFIGEVDDHRNAELRGLLAGMAKMASGFGCAVVCVSHLRKSGGLAVHQAIGSLAYTAAARAVWSLLSDPEDEGRRLLLPVKMNLARDTTGLAFRLAFMPADPVDGSNEGCPVLQWEPDPITMKADDILNPAIAKGRPPHERDEAAEWLSCALADGPRGFNDLVAAARADGISEATLKNARVKARVKSFKNGYQGPWVWGLKK